MFVVSDNFIRDVVREVFGQLSSQRDANALQKAAILINGDVTLAAYFQSMLAYFTGTAKPAETLLTLKLKELIVSILLGGRNPELAGYFQSLLKSDAPVLSQIMEANFSYNLSLEDFARLSHRSLSTFKRDFRKYYNQSPGKWLLQKRLDYSAVLLKNPALNVSQVAFDSGFEDLSHSAGRSKKNSAPPQRITVKKLPVAASRSLVKQTSCRLLKKIQRRDARRSISGGVLLHVDAQSVESTEAYGFLAGSRRLLKSPDASRARMGERVGVFIPVRRSESFGAQRSRWNFSATCMTKSRSVKHLASQTKHLSLPGLIFGTRINL